ncbi:hypothetical protein [Defluviimonas sp. SAOS-178_SWC]|uniref:hypothetical protein n=1 Tax=Defluviimonas sp. SAOS-178_SWC TaxID=3121287 RepID=UPI003221CE6F
MAREREVGTLWIGGPLSWMEQVCLKSFVDKGQRITLFSYEDIPNVPAGVIRRDGREILDTDDFIKYEQKDSYALFADLFRLHMIHRCPRMIWIDTDVYCHRPMDYDDDYVMGFELPGEHRVNNAVLGLPADSDMLARMLEFTSDRFSIAPFLPRGRQDRLRKARDAGRPVHVSQQPWGVWGPMMVTHFVHELGLAGRVQPLNAFYPITFRDRAKFLRDASIVEALLTDDTTALHLWASNKKQIGNHHAGLPPAGSYLDRLVRAHGIRPELAPIKGRGRAVFDGALIDTVDLEEVTSVADLTGTARGFVLALHHKYDCDITLIDVNGHGKFGDPTQPWIEPYIAFLEDHGVDRERIRVVRSEKEMRPVDVLCNLNGFGDRHNIRGLKTFLERCLHADSRLFMDIRKGSGAFPFLKPFGTNDVIADRVESGKDVTRVVVSPRPPDNAAASESWDRIATDLAGRDGFYRAGPAGHSFLYIPRSKGTLVVTFDNLDIAMNKRDDRRPWGYSLIESRNWSMLGVLAGGWTWYREPWVASQFDELRDSGFFDQFERVVFYGASMGGYAACAFSPAAPGCDVVAISPQSTVDKSLVPWETRYKVVWDRDFSGPYGDAAAVSRAARRVYILYDPYEPLDAAHAARFSQGNVQHLRAPLLGHRLGSSLNQMGILSPIILGALSGSLTRLEFYTLLRARREFPRYQRELFERAVNSGHIELARRLGHYILSQGDNPAVRRRLGSIPAAD